MHQLLERQPPRSQESTPQQLERRYRRVQTALTGATASYEALSESPNVSERQLERTRREVEELQRHLNEVLESLERAEELEDQST